MRNDHFILNLWKWKCGIEEDSFIPIEMHDEKSLAETEWSGEFEQLMRNRLIFGAYRYGYRINDPKKPAYDRIGSAFLRLKKYQKTGNREHLVDVANMLLLEFEEGIHPLSHFEAGDDTQHTKKLEPVITATQKEPFSWYEPAVEFEPVGLCLPILSIKTTK